MNKDQDNEWETITLQVKRDPNTSIPGNQIIYQGKIYTCIEDKPIDSFKRLKVFLQQIKAFSSVSDWMSDIEKVLVKKETP